MFQNSHALSPLAFIRGMVFPTLQRAQRNNRSVQTAREFMRVEEGQTILAGRSLRFRSPSNSTTFFGLFTRLPPWHYVKVRYAVLSFGWPNDSLRCLREPEAHCGTWVGTCVWMLNIQFFFFFWYYVLEFYSIASYLYLVFDNKINTNIQYEIVFFPWK